MNTTSLKKSAVLERRNYWAKLISVYESSGLTQHAFAEAHGIKKTQLIRWKYRLSKKQVVNEGDVEKIGVAKKGKQTDAVKFIPMQLCDEKGACIAENLNSVALSAFCVTVSKEGFSIGGIESVDVERLKPLLRVLLEIVRC